MPEYVQSIIDKVVAEQHGSKYNQMEQLNIMYIMIYIDWRLIMRVLKMRRRRRIRIGRWHVLPWGSWKGCIRIYWLWAMLWSIILMTRLLSSLMIRRSNLGILPSLLAYSINGLRSMVTQHWLPLPDGSTHIIWHWPVNFRFRRIWIIPIMRRLVSTGITMRLWRSSSRQPLRGKITGRSRRSLTTTDLI